MKKLKSLLSIILTGAFISVPVFSSMTVSAEESWQLSDNELKGAMTALEEFNESIDLGAEVYSIDAEVIADDLLAKGYDMNKAYKSFCVKPYIIQEYKSSGSFKSLIEDSYHIQVPAGKSLYSININDGKYEYAGSATGEEEVTDYVAEINKFSEIIKENTGLEILNAAHLYADLYYLDLLYFETKDNEYIVPYDTSCLENPYILSGTIYTASDFMTVMDRTYDESKYIDMESEAEKSNQLLVGGGVGEKADAIAAQANEFDPFPDKGLSHNTIGVIIIASSLVLLLAISAAAYIAYRRSSSKKSDQ